jgi:hypothetical protein
MTLGVVTVGVEVFTMGWRKSWSSDSRRMEPRSNDGWHQHFE